MFNTIRINTYLEREKMSAKIPKKEKMKSLPFEVKPCSWIFQEGNYILNIYFNKSRIIFNPCTKRKSKWEKKSKPRNGISIYNSRLVNVCDTSFKSMVLQAVISCQTSASNSELILRSQTSLHACLAPIKLNWPSAAIKTQGNRLKRKNCQYSERVFHF